MTVTHQTRDHLLADVELATSRLHRFENDLADLAPSDREPFAHQLAVLTTRCGELKEQIMAWPEIKIGTAGALEDLGAAIDALEADFDAAQHGEPAGYRSAVDRQLRAWRSRSDRLRLQGALASMDVRDDLDEVGNRLANARAGVLLELRDATADAKDVVVDLRNDVEEVLVDLRRAIERAAEALMRPSHH